MKFTYTFDQRKATLLAGMNTDNWFVDGKEVVDEYIYCGAIDMIFHNYEFGLYVAEQFAKEIKRQKITVTGREFLGKIALNHYIMQQYETYKIEKDLWGVPKQLMVGAAVAAAGIATGYIIARNTDN